MAKDYIVAVDEYGQPYIAHAVKMTRKPAFGHKSPLFLDKVQLPNGKYRYFYTRKAYEAWLKNQKPTIKEQKEMADKKKTYADSEPSKVLRDDSEEAWLQIRRSSKSVEGNTCA